MSSTWACRRPARQPCGERTAYLRLYDGEVTERQRLTFRRRDADGRTREVSGRVTHLDVTGGGSGPLTAGNIAALTGLAGIRVGDRLGDPPRSNKTRAGAPPSDRAPQFAPPTLETEVSARHPEQAARLRSALLTLADQDPLIHARPTDAGTTALLLYGEVQMEVLAATLAQDFGVEADFAPGRVRFLERPRGAPLVQRVCQEILQQRPPLRPVRHEAGVVAVNGAGVPQVQAKVACGLGRDSQQREPLTAQRSTHF